MVEPPLLSAFLELRRRRFPLGISDYLAALTALEKGIGVDSRSALLHLCETLWGKSRAEQRRIKRIVEKTLPPEPEAASASSHRPRAGSVEDSRPAPAAGAPESARRAPAASSRPAVSVELAAGRDRADDEVTATIDLSNLGAAPAWRPSPHFELEPRPPVEAREMSRAWRGYRRAGRSGPKTELDVEAAIDEIRRHGILRELPMIASRSNRARLLLLVDEGGSMQPFRYVTDALVLAARKAGMARLAVRYFHDVPGAVVYRDPTLRQAEPLAELGAGFIDQGILIFGDAGSARGRYDRARVDSGARVIAGLRELTPTVVWLNPVPRRRWRGTSAAALAATSQVPMYTLSRIGLRAAIRALHGRSH